MTNKQILKKAIKKAEKGGFNKMGDTEKFVEAFQYSCKDLLFNHDFAKAFWGEKDFDAYSDEHFDKWWTNQGLGRIYVPNCQEMNFNGRVWEFHLQQMVLEKEPLKYIEKFL